MVCVVITRRAVPQVPTHYILLYWVPERRATIEIIRRPLNKGTKHNCGKTECVQPLG